MRTDKKIIAPILLARQGSDVRYKSADRGCNIRNAVMMKNKGAALNRLSASTCCVMVLIALTGLLAAQEHFVEVVESELDPGRTAVIALVGAFGLFHLT